MNEKALWLAILIQSTMDLVGINLPDNKLRENRDRRSARAWFEGDGDDVGSFVWTCEVLGLEADDYRRRVFKIAATNPRQLMQMRKHEYSGGRQWARPPAPLWSEQPAVSFTVVYDSEFVPLRMVDNGTSLDS